MRSREQLTARTLGELSRLHRQTILADARLTMNVQSIDHVWEDVKQKISCNLADTTINSTVRAYGGWVADRFALVCMLDRWRKPESMVDMERLVTTLENCPQEPDSRTLLRVAPVLLPNLTEHVLASHGLTA